MAITTKQVPPITHRLSLTDSNNHSVFIDIDIWCLEDTEKSNNYTDNLLDAYKTLLKEEEEKAQASIENDAEVAKVAEKKQAEKQKALNKPDEADTTQDTEVADESELDEA